MGFVAIDKLLIDIEIKSDKALRQIKSIEQVMADIDKKIQKTNTSFKNNNSIIKGFQNLFLGMGLAFLFTGMAIQRMFENILTSLFQTFMAVEGPLGVVSNKVGEIVAGLEFLKFSFVDAFKDSGMLDVWIDRINKIIKYFTDLDDSTKAWLVNASIWGAIAATVMMIIGMTLLFLLGPLALIDFFFKTKLVASLATFSKALFGFLTSPLGIALLAIFGTLWLLSDKLGGLKNAFKGLGIFLLQIFATVIEVAMLPFVEMINLIISGINKAIKASNSLLGTNISTVGEIDAFGWSKKVWAMRNELLAEGEAKKAEQQKLANIGEINYNPEINVTQLPGEDTDAFTKKLMDSIDSNTSLFTEKMKNIMNEKNYEGIGSPQGGF